MERITIDLYRESMGKGHGLVAAGDNPGEYTIIINGDETPPEQLAAFIHEMIHIYNHDLEAQEDVQAIETRTHKQVHDVLQILDAGTGCQ